MLAAMLDHLKRTKMIQLYAGTRAKGRPSGLQRARSDVLSFILNTALSADVCTLASGRVVFFSIRWNPVDRHGLFAFGIKDLTRHSGIENSEMDVTRGVYGDSSQQDLAIEIRDHGCCFDLF